MLPQTATLVYAISGITDAVVSTANQSLLVNLADVFPIATTMPNQTIWSENWETWSATSNSWTFVPEANHGSSANAKTFIPYGNYGCSNTVNNVTSQLFTNDANGNLAYCSNSGGAYTAMFYRAINAASNHYTNMSINFNYNSGANANITNAMIYSTNNGASWDTLATYPFANTTTNATYNISALKPFLNNVDFLIGWQSVGKSAATYSQFGFGIDDIVVSGDITTPQIDSTVSSTATNYQTSGQNIDFYSANNKIFANIANPTADLGCVTASIENAGSTWQPYKGGTRSQKVFLITPSTNAVTAQYNNTLYFTTTELGGINPSSLRIAKTTASSIATSDASNTVLVTPTTVSKNAYGVAFTGVFSGFSRFFLVDNIVVLPIVLVDFKASLINGNSELTWITSSEINNHQFDVEVSKDGTNFEKLSTVLSKGNSTSNVAYNYTHVKPAAGIYYYRLKQIDNDGRFVYSKTIAINITNAGIAKAFLYPIPASTFITLNFGTIVQQATINMYSIDLKLLQTENVAQATVTKDFDIAKLPAGSYILRITTANKTEILRFVKE